MLKILNKYKKWLIIGSFLYVYLILILVSPSGYSATTPGEISNTGDIYNIEGKTFNDNINTVVVYSWHEITTFQKWITENNSKYNVEELSEYESTLSSKELRLQGKISNDASHLSAIITAYKYAAIKDKSIKIDYTLDGFSVYATNNSNLKIGDVIISIDNLPLNTNSYEDYLTTLNLYDSNRPNSFTTNDLKKIIVLRDNNQLEIELQANSYIYHFPKYSINNDTINPKITIQPEKNVGGPSGGMIQTLSIYVALRNIKIDSKVAGTGTIQLDNDANVGKIGGLVQKFHTVTNNKVDIFIIPKSQYHEIESLVTNKTKFEIFQVENFDDVVSLLENGDIK